MLNLVIIILVLLIAIFLYLYIIAKRELNMIQKVYDELLHEHRSSTIKHGMSFEQLFPFMNNYPYNPRNFRFIGTPIDGLSFEDDKIVFIEFKTGKSALSNLQQRIKDLINKKKVEWKEIRES